MYRLPDNVFSCLANGRLVFLDLENNKYSCLTARDTHSATRILGVSSSCLCESSINSPEVVDDEDNRILEALTKAGLVIQENFHESGRQTRPTITIPETSLDFRLADRATHHPIRYSIAFYRSAFMTSWKLRYWSMKRTVHKVGHQRRRIVTRTSKAGASMDELIAVFTSLRSYYVRNYLCLFDSLCLIEFLAHFGHVPILVFGVKTDPFAAHCWVQDDVCVLNDHVEYVREFTPIMTA